MLEVDLDEVVRVPQADEEMNAAINSARSSLDIFLTAHAHPRPGQEGFMVKVRFSRDDNFEHIWTAELDMKSTPFSGELANEPGLPGMRCGERLTFTEDQISDWMYVEGGKIAGGFTTKLLLKRQYERKLDAAFLPIPLIN